MSRWLEETGGTRGADYAEQFRELAASGVDVHGEAAYVDALLPRRARVLDAGCGTGRVGAELARRGHDVLGVDSDPSMLEQARGLPGRWLLADLAELDLPERFDLVVAAGNVVVYLAPGTEPAVLGRLAAHLVPGGLLVAGWRTDLLAVPSYDLLVRHVGLEPVARHATWSGGPLHDDAPWCIAVDRAPVEPVTAPGASPSATPPAPR